MQVGSGVAEDWRIELKNPMTATPPSSRTCRDAGSAVAPAYSGEAMGRWLPSTVVCSRSTKDDPAVVWPLPATTMTPAPAYARLNAMVLLLIVPAASWLKMPPPSPLEFSRKRVPSMTSPAAGSL